MVDSQFLPAAKLGSVGGSATTRRPQGCRVFLSSPAPPKVWCQPTALGTRQRSWGQRRAKNLRFCTPAPLLWDIFFLNVISIYICLLIFRNALRGCHKIPIIEKSSSYKALQRLKLFITFSVLYPSIFYFFFFSHHHLLQMLPNKQKTIKKKHYYIEL